MHAWWNLCKIRSFFVVWRRCICAFTRTTHKTRHTHAQDAYLYRVCLGIMCERMFSTYLSMWIPNIYYYYFFSFEFIRRVNVLSLHISAARMCACFCGFARASRFFAMRGNREENRNIDVYTVIIVSLACSFIITHYYYCYHFLLNIASHRIHIHLHRNCIFLHINIHTIHR